MLASSANAEIHWKPGPGISNNVIKKKHGIKWFHYKESTTLRYKGIDRDKKCDDDDENPTWAVDYTTNRMDYENTAWSGDGIAANARGKEAEWSPDQETPAGGVTVSVQGEDLASADDPAVAVASKQMYAFAVIAKVNASGSNDATTTVSVNERVDGAATERSVVISLSSGGYSWANAKYLAPTASNVILDTTPAFVYDSEATWSLATKPAGVTPGSGGDLSATTSAVASGALSTLIDDSDLIDIPGTVSLTLSIPVILGPKITYTLVSSALDHNEAMGTLGFVFASDHLQSQLSTELKKTSGNDSETDNGTTHSVPITYSASKIFIGSSTATKSAKTLIKGQGRAECQGGMINSPPSWYYSKAGIKSTGTIAYKVKAPKYVGAKLNEYDPEDGYDD